jgi:5'-3' exonuclease
MYANLDGSGRTQYYNSYFKIDPNHDINSLGNILGYYVYGLKFVYQYYFQNLASWSWYYPYYFAPLLSDLNLYLANILQVGHTLEAFDLGAPFEPFKQLLCILPKESADLLPANFQKYILE